MLLTLQDKGLRITAWLGNMKPLLLEDLSLELAVSGKRPGEFLDPSHHQPSNQALTVPPFPDDGWKAQAWRY